MFIRRSSAKKASLSKRIGVGFLLLVVGYFAAVKAYDIARDRYGDWAPRPTPFPASTQPDGVCLTWSDDPQTTQTAQWRTSPEVAEGCAQYRPADQPDAQPLEVAATHADITDKSVKNDPVIRRFTAVLRDLKPGAAYAYRVGDKTKDAWSAWRTFKTAPADAPPFSFIYLGDAQVGLAQWGGLVQEACQARPQAAFIAIAGDLVNNGCHREEWDEFFHAGQGVFDAYPLVPTIGNHDYGSRDLSNFYRDHLALPTDGPNAVAPELAYTFRYSNVFFVVLDSNLDPKTQDAWLDQQLANANATWKIALYHHPLYASKDHRENTALRAKWGALFDKYHLDLALQGHDHAYLRTYPMRDGQRAAAPKDGTTYVVSVSGSKFYPQMKTDYAAATAVDVSLYHTVDITQNPDRLVFRSYAAGGKLLDEFEIVK